MVRNGDHCRLDKASPLLSAGAAAALLALGATPAAAQRIENAIAVFAALDKVTARISKLEVPLNQTVKFGALKLTPRSCYTRAPTEPPKTTSFVEVDEILLEGKEKRIFSGWMFAESPGLNALEHPVFDLWLTSCTAPQRAPAARPPPQAGTVPGPRPPFEAPGARVPVEVPPPAEEPRRRRVPR
jgi:hypothetical protein